MWISTKTESRSNLNLLSTNIEIKFFLKLKIIFDKEMRSVNLHKKNTPSAGSTWINVLNSIFNFYPAHVRHYNNLFSLMSGVTRKEQTLFAQFSKTYSALIYVLCCCDSHLWIFEKSLCQSHTGFWLEEIFCISLDLALTTSGFE